MSFLYFLEGLRTPALDAFFSAITHLGSETLFMAIAIAVFWCVSKYDGLYLLSTGFFWHTGKPVSQAYLQSAPSVGARSQLYHS